MLVGHASRLCAKSVATVRESYPSARIRQRKHQNVGFYSVARMKLHFILNCINVPYYAERRGWQVDHLGSRLINQLAHQIYSVNGAKYAVRCVNSNFNNICFPVC